MLLAAQRTELVASLQTRRRLKLSTNKTAKSAVANPAPLKPSHTRDSSDHRRRTRSTASSAMAKRQGSRR